MMFKNKLIPAIVLIVAVITVSLFGTQPVQQPKAELAAKTSVC